MRTPLGFLSLLTLVSACASTGPDVNSEIDSYVRTLPYLPVEPAQVTPGAQGATTRDGDYSCTTENFRETRALDRIVAYAANSDSLWPGAIVSADSVLSGLFTQVV